jgi:putative transposase
MAVFRNIALKYPEIEILEMNTDEDHIHLMIIIPPKIAVSHAVNILKSNSARAMRRRFPFLASMYEHDDLGFWSDGYFVSTAGLNEYALQNYIKNQGKEDKGQTKFVW